MTASGNEQPILIEVVSRLQAEGWQVLTEVALPRPFGSLRPDVVATRAGEVLIVEIAAAAVFDPAQSPLADAAAVAGFSYRVYGAAPRTSIWASRLATAHEQPAAESIRAAIRELADSPKREPVDVALYRAFDLATVAAMRLEEEVGLRRPHGFPEEAEDLDPSALVEHGFLGQNDVAVLFLARSVLERAGRSPEGDALGTPEFDEDARETIRRLLEIASKLSTEIDLFVNTQWAPTSGHRRSQTTYAGASGVEPRAAFARTVEVVDEILSGEPERVWRNQDVLRALVDRGYPTDRADVNQALSDLARAGRLRRISRGHYTTARSRERP